MPGVWQGFPRRLETEAHIATHTKTAKPKKSNAKAADEANDKGMKARKLTPLPSPVRARRRPPSQPAPSAATSKERTLANCNTTPRPPRTNVRTAERLSPKAIIWSVTYQYIRGRDSAVSSVTGCSIVISIWGSIRKMVHGKDKGKKGKGKPKIQPQPPKAAAEAAAKAVPSKERQSNARSLSQGASAGGGANKAWPCPAKCGLTFPNRGFMRTRKNIHKFAGWKLPNQSSHCNFDTFLIRAMSVLY